MRNTSRLQNVLNPPKDFSFFKAFGILQSFKRSFDFKLCTYFFNLNVGRGCQEKRYVSLNSIYIMNF